MAITKIDDIYLALKKKREKKRLVIASAGDYHSIEAAYKAVKLGIVDVILCGDKKIILDICKEYNFDSSVFKIVDEPTDVKAATVAVQMIHNNEADFLMKGLISTDKYMRVILNKESGLLPPKGVLSHVTIVENRHYHKLLVLGDVAIIPAPDLDQKIAIVKYVSKTAAALGIERPKVAILSASEQVLPRVNSTIEAAIISKMGERGQLGNIEVDGPLALDGAIDKEAAEIKKLKSPVAGDADCLVFPNIEAGNVFYKTITKLTDSRLGAILVGATAPCVLSSRGDSVDTKLNSIAIAALLS